MAFSQIVYAGGNTGRGPSPCIWTSGAIPVEMINENPNFGAIFWDDFKSVAGGAPSAGAKSGVFGDTPWIVYGGGTAFGSFVPVAGGTAALQAPTIAGQIGAVAGIAVAVAHDNFAMEPGGLSVGTTTIGAGTAETPVGIYGCGGVMGQLPKLAFECKIMLDAVDATQCMFVGMAEPNMTAKNTMFTIGDAFGTKSLIGFWSTATSAIKAGYNKNGQAAVQVGASGTLVASTYTKLGFLYDPTDTVNGVLKFFQDGVLLGRVMTPPASTAFPSGVGLVPLLYVQNAGAGAAARTITCDWVRVGMMIDQP